jgi:hypothetical protein
MSRREGPEEAAERWALLNAVARHYKDFVEFLRDGMAFLGFSASEIQEDIAKFMVDGPASIMVQAQRGQAKTTIAALFVVWSLVHAPHLRCLVVSAGGTQANEISTLIVRVIQTWDILECMRPDSNAGDRTSVEHFDVHYSLKGIDKSPSVACVGITANLQGKRADILLADDVESAKNSLTAIMRGQLLHLTRDFTSICMGRDGRPGRIIWLGTPQSTDSIYNTLPSRGVAIRIWPGRYPTATEIDNYGEYLAPLLVRRMRDDPSLQSGGGLMGDKGKPIDPSYMGEEVLQRKLLDQGEAYFQLQHMLDTRLSDALRYPLKPERLVFMRLDHTGRVPMEVIPGATRDSLAEFSVGTHRFRMNQPQSGSLSAYTKVVGIHMNVDPAGGGQNGDETGFAVSGAANGNIFLFAVGGVPGGYELNKLEALAEVAARWKVNVLTIEKNMGYGAFREVFLPVLKRIHPNCAVEDDLVHGQKERRIQQTLEPIVGRGSLIVNEDCVAEDWQQAQRYGPSLALTYSFFFQFCKLTLERGALLHDDRLDAVEGTCRYWQVQLGQDQGSLRQKYEEQVWKQMTSDPLGYKRYAPPQARPSILNRVLRRR